MAQATVNLVAMNYRIWLGFVEEGIDIMRSNLDVSRFPVWRIYDQDPIDYLFENAVFYGDLHTLGYYMNAYKWAFTKTEKALALHLIQRRLYSSRDET